jgi:hypothetical protein
MTIPFVIIMSFAAVATYDSIRIGQEYVPLRPWRRRGGGGSEVAGAGDAGIGLTVATDGGDEVSPEDVGGEEKVLRAGAGDVCRHQYH